MLEENKVFLRTPPAVLKNSSKCFYQYPPVTPTKFISCHNLALDETDWAPHFFEIILYI